MRSELSTNKYGFCTLKTNLFNLRTEPGTSQTSKLTTKHLPQLLVASLPPHCRKSTRTQRHTTCYYLLLLVTTCYYLLLLVTTCYYLLLLVTTCYYLLLLVTKFLEHYFLLHHYYDITFF